MAVTKSELRLEEHLYYLHHVSMNDMPVGYEAMEEKHGALHREGHTHVQKNVKDLPKGPPGTRLTGPK